MIFLEFAPQSCIHGNYQFQRFGVYFVDIPLNFVNILNTGGYVLNIGRKAHPFVKRNRC